MEIKIGSSEELNVAKVDIISFYKNNWSRKISLSNEEFFSWQFLDTPIQKGNQCCVALQGHEVVAVMGLHERKFTLKGKACNGAELTTWIVRDDKRKLGLGPKMLDYIQSKYSVLFGMGISDQALPIYLRKGFKFIKSIPRFVKPINIYAIQNFGFSTPLLKKLQRLKVTKKQYIESFPAKNEINNIFMKFLDEANLFDRDFKWISWRYDKHPSFSYVVRVIKNNNEKKCIVVYRIDKLNDLTMMHCVDLYGEFDAFSSAISYLEDKAIENGVDVIDFYSTNSRTNSAFIKNNWLSILDSDFFGFPHLFHPIELRSPSTTSLTLWSDDLDGALYDFGSLYITKQDCDFDRPTANNL